MRQEITVLYPSGMQFPIVATIKEVEEMKAQGKIVAYKTASRVVNYRGLERYAYRR